MGGRRAERNEAPIYLQPAQAWSIAPIA